MRNTKQIFCTWLAMLLAAGSMSACGQNTQPETDTDTARTSDTTENAADAETDADPYAGIDLEGMELRLLNVEGRQWGLMSIIEYPEQTGVALDDAIYNRNRTLEEKLNMKLVVTEKPTDDCKGALNASVLAGTISMTVCSRCRTTSPPMSLPETTATSSTFRRCIWRNHGGNPDSTPFSRSATGISTA